jgi:hypothetical protein
MQRLFWMLGFIIWSHTAFADGVDRYRDVPLGIETASETRFGTLRIVRKDIIDRDITLDGRVIMTTGYGVSGLKVIDWGDRGDVVFMIRWSGGASCCYSHQIIHITADGETVTPMFADHGYDPKDFVVTPDRIRFRLERDYPANVDHFAVSYDGSGVTVFTVMEDDRGVQMASAGDSLLRREGQSPRDLLEDPGERVRFRTVMADEDMILLRAFMSNGIMGLTVKDGYLVGYGCQPRWCNERFGFVAINIATGEPFAAYTAYPYECSFNTFGPPDRGLPAPVWKMINETRLHMLQYTLSLEHPRRQYHCRGKGM